MIKKIKLISLELEGFRKFKEKVVIDLRAGLNTIIADNANGKSTVGLGIMWAVGGHDFDNKRQELGIINDESSIASVLIKFEDELGNIRTILRKETKSSTSIRLDGKIKSQKALSEVIDPQLFALILNPLWYMNMDTNTMRNFLQKNSDIITVEDVFSSMKSGHKLIVENFIEENKAPTTVGSIMNLFDVIKKELKEKEKEDELNVGLIEKLTNELSEVTNEELIKFDESELLKKKNELKDRIDKTPILDVGKTRVYQEKKDKLQKLKATKLKTEKEISDSLLEAPKLQEQLTTIQNAVFVSKATYELESLQKELEAMVSDYTEAGETIKSLISAVNVLNVEVESNPQIQQAIDVLKKVCNEQKAKRVEIKSDGEKKRAQEKKLTGQIESDTKNFLAKKEKSLLEINEKIKLNKNKHDNAVLALKLFNDESSGELNILENAVSSNNFNEYADSIEKDAVAYKEALTPLKEEIKALQEQKQEIDERNKKINTSIAILKKKDEEKVTLESRAIALKSEIERLIELRDVFSMFFIKKSELSSTSITKHFNNVSFVFEKIVKYTGELKPCLEIMFNGKSLIKASNSEIIRAGLEISTAVNKLSGTEYPTFIDNGESITEYDSTPFSQIIQTIVTKDEGLTIVYEDGTRENLIEHEPAISKVA